ncbi:hypothetical protein ALC62_11981 [Cyphomyrmex costatus]|uniref:Envelope fusion protein n=1 Tax=Cyphomyrmex costatus TaxID=456900 RepID=A0A151IC17_9HYME|nr:hypothetical protein ALC62_11981 [Cyphomyrmex costatus]
MELQLDQYTQREDLDEHLQILTAILTDSTADIDKTLDFLAYSKDGIVPTRLLPLENIIMELREAATQLTKGLHFPFQIKLENWDTIHKYVAINAIIINNVIFTTLKFPIIAYPTYKIIKVIPFPIHEQENIFKFIKIIHPIIALDKENNHYTLLRENELNKCIRDITTYTCERNFPIYNIKSNAPCEVLVYINTPGQLQNCEYGRVLSSTTLWIAPLEENTWLYSSKEGQECIISCNDKKDEKIEINATGKIQLTGNCKLTTSEIILRTKTQLETRYIQTNVPEFNLTLNKEQETTFDLPKRTPLRHIIKDTEELTKLSLETSEIQEYLKGDNILSNYRYI